MTNSNTVNVDGSEYSVARSFSDTRAIVSYDGLFVLVDKVADGSWQLSGTPANHEEKAALVQLLANMNDVSVLDVSKD